MSTTDFKSLVDEIWKSRLKSRGIQGIYLVTLESFHKDPQLANLHIFEFNQKAPHTKGRQLSLSGKILPKEEEIPPTPLGRCSSCQQKVDISSQNYFLHILEGNHYTEEQLYRGYCDLCHNSDYDALSSQLKKKWKIYVKKYGTEQAKEVLLLEIQGKDVQLDKANCTMCGNEMIFIKKKLPFKDKCRKCNYSFTFVYKKINLGKDEFGDTKYEDGIKPTRPKPPRATVKSTGREPIPQDLMDTVWNRDGGHCVKCGSKQDLEYDHMIPLSKGGSNSYKNLQLLCRKCNRSKSDNIG